MRGFAERGGAALAIARRDLQTFVSYRVRLVTQVLTVFFSLTLFYYLSRLVRVETFASPDAYFAFVVVGLLIVQVLNSTLSAPPNIMRQELVAGTFERLLVSPTGPVWGLISTLLFPFCFALIMALIMLGLAGLLFGLPVQWTTAPLALPLAALGALAFLPFGIVLLAGAVIVKQIAGGATWMVTGISLIAGLYFPVTLLPDWIEWTSEIQPFTPAVDLLRNVLVGTPLADPIWLDLARLAGFSAVALPAAVWTLHRAIAAGRRRGTLIEY